MGRAETEPEVSDMTEEQCFDRAKKHYQDMQKAFDGEPVLVAIEAVSMLLYQLWFDVMQEQGMPFDEFAANVGRYMGALHANREKHRRAMH